MKYSGKADFDLAQTLDCGQCFCWTKQDDGSWSGVASGHTLRILQNEDGSLCPSGLPDFWRSYFDLDTDYGVIRDGLSEMHPVLKEAVSFAPGIRILNQDPWEGLCSFIVSQNNNIPRIKGLIRRLCAQFGEPAADGLYSFPAPERLAGADEVQLRGLGCGFRAGYILDAARKTASGEIELDRLRSAGIDEARSALMSIRGVGPKVADCALLYGLHRLDAFPLDVWIKRAMELYFPGKDPSFFGPYAGIAQQYLFHYMRKGRSAAPGL